jgi:hypothetical protein
LSFRDARGIADYLQRMLPAVIAHLPADRERLGLSPVEMAARRGLTFRQYVALGAGEIELDDNALYLRICQVCPWEMRRRVNAVCAASNGDLG